MEELGVRRRGARRGSVERRPSSWARRIGRVDRVGARSWRKLEACGAWRISRGGEPGATVRVMGAHWTRRARRDRGRACVRVVHGVAVQVYTVGVCACACSTKACACVCWRNRRGSGPRRGAGPGRADRVRARRERGDVGSARGGCVGGAVWRASGRVYKPLSHPCVAAEVVEFELAGIHSQALVWLLGSTAEAAAARCDGHDDDNGSRNSSGDGRSWFRGRNVSRKPRQAVGAQCWSLRAVGQARVARGCARRVRGEPGQVVCVVGMSACVC